MSEKKIPTAEEVQRLVKTLEGQSAGYMVLEWETFVSLRMSSLASLSAEETKAYVHEVTGRPHPSSEDAVEHYQEWLNTVFRAQLEKEAKTQHPGLPPDFRLMAVEIRENTITALPWHGEVDMEWGVNRKATITSRQRAGATQLPESSELLVADYSSLEARIAAQLLSKEAILAPPPADRKSLRSVAALLTGMALGVDLEAKPAREERGRREQVEFLLSSLSTETLQQLRDLKNLIRTAPNRRARRIAEALARKADRQLRPLDVTLDEAMEVV